MNDAAASDDRIRGYAAGLLEIARGEGQLDRVEGELAQIGRAVGGSEDLRNTLGDPAVPLERRLGVVNDLVGGRAADVTQAIVNLIVSAGRSRDIPAIAEAFVAAAAASRSREVAEVRSAISLDADTVRRLEESLGRATGKDVEVKVVVDPSVIGGLVARVGDTVIDGSVRRRLDSLRQALKAN